MLLYYISLAVLIVIFLVVFIKGNSLITKLKKQLDKQKQLNDKQAELVVLYQEAYDEMKDDYDNYLMTRKLAVGSLRENVPSGQYIKNWEDTNKWIKNNSPDYVHQCLIEHHEITNIICEKSKEYAVLLDVIEKDIEKQNFIDLGHHINKAKELRMFFSNSE